MTLYYFRIEEGNGQDTSVHISANKEKLEDIREGVKEEMGHLGSVTVEPIKYTSKGNDTSNWASFYSVSIMTAEPGNQKEGQKLYYYTVEDGDESEGVVATNREDIEALHHDAQIPASEDEKQNVKVGEIKSCRGSVILDSPTYIE
jgi:hypothetical protein